MGKFQADEVIEPLEYDFSKYVPGCQGAIPEPSDKQVQHYFKAISEISSEMAEIRARMMSVQAKGGDVADDDPEVAELMAEMKDFDLTEMLDRIAAEVAVLCSHQPSVEQIKGLPFRIRQEFIKWVGSQFRSA